MQSEFVPVSKNFKAAVIGTHGSVIQDMRQRSGAQIRSAHREEEGFTVSGYAEQIASAKRLILEKLEEIKTWEPAEIPEQWKGLIIGKGGANLRDLYKQTGAELTRTNGEVFIISGTEEQRKHAKVIIALKVAFARLRNVENEFNKFCYFIDDCNLPKNCRLKLEKVQEEDYSVLPSSQTQYKLKPTEEPEPQELSISNNDPSYLEQLSDAVLEKLHMFKYERREEDFLEADMWCQFGRATIRGPGEEEAAERKWSIDEATGKFQTSVEKRYWKFTFNEKVDISEDIFKGNYSEKTPEEYTEYATRYDLTFLSPRSYQVRCKVWVAKEDTRKKLEDIPIPSTDVKNMLENIDFEDELTRSRCRGWLVLPPRRYLQADILFPGCEFDCRFTVRGQTGNAEAIDNVPKEEVRRILSQYLSGLTLSKDDAFGIRLPENELPEGFRFIHKRSSKRTVYTAKPGFSIILSKECSWRSVGADHRSKELIDLQLHCDEWDKLLSSGQWKPEVILQKLPEFLQFVKDVQGFVAREMQSRLKGPLMQENLRVLDIPQQQIIDLSVFLSGGDEWKLLAGRVGLNSERIRYLDKRFANPAGELLAFIGTKSSMTLGELYDLFNECGLPAVADRL